MTRDLRSRGLRVGVRGFAALDATALRAVLHRELAGELAAPHDDRAVEVSLVQAESAGRARSQVLVLEPDDVAGARAALRGRTSTVTWSSAPEHVASAVVAAARGVAWSAPDVGLVRQPVHRPGSASAALAVLTERQREVADLLARGLTRREAAARLGLLPSTLHSHLARTYAATGRHSELHLVLLVLQARQEQQELGQLVELDLRDGAPPRAVRRRGAGHRAS